MPNRRRCVVTFGLLLATVAPASAVDVSTCGHILAARQKGVLVADLVCADGVGVELGRSAKLDLNGHAIVMASGVAIRCVVGRCVVSGPGLLDGQGTAASGLTLQSRVSLALTDVDVAAFTYGVFGSGQNRVTIRDVELDGCTTSGIDLQDRGTLRAEGLSVRNTVGPIGRAVHATQCRGKNWSITDNPAVFFDRSQSGVACGDARITALTATDNGGPGLWAGARAMLRDPVLTGNDADGDGIDLISDDRPKLKGGTCGRSADENGVPWGVCVND